MRRSHFNIAVFNSALITIIKAPHNFFKDTPRELREAALIDGTSHFTVFRRIFLPISLLATMRASGFNKLRMGVLPKHSIFNTNEPLRDIYQRDDAGKLDFDRPNVVTVTPARAVAEQVESPSGRRPRFRGDDD